MTITQIGQLLGSLISTYMGLDPSRVVLKDENFDAPTDQNLYVLIEYESGDIIGIVSNVDTDTGVETMSDCTMEHFNIEVCSRNRDANDRYQEVQFALQSVAGQQTAEMNQCAFFRGGPTLNLSSVEGAGDLKRWRVPVIVSNVRTKTDTAPLITEFTSYELDEEA